MVIGTVVNVSGRKVTVAIGGCRIEVEFTVENKIKEGDHVTVG